jgi:hypothetical protein
MTAIVRPALDQGHLDAVVDSVAFPCRPAFLPLRLDGVDFDVITDTAVLREAFALRFKAYTEARYIDPADYPLSAEFDDYDNVSVHFGAHLASGGEMVGYVRLILDTRGRMQIDDIVSIADYRTAFAGHLCEMSRLIVRPPLKGVSRCIRHVAFRWAEMLDIRCIVGASQIHDREAFDRRRFLPMTPERIAEYRGTRLRLLQGHQFYGNVFDVAGNRAYIAALIES